MANPGVDALPDQVSFQLGDRRDYREKRLPQRTARIDIFLVADELNAQRAELLQRQQQVLGASCKAVEAPDDDGVELPLTRVGYQAIQLWPRVFGAGFAYVDVFSKDFEFPRRAVSSQIAELEIAALVFSAHAGVNRNSHSLDLRSRGSGGQDGGLNGPFLNQEEASPIVLILPGQFHRFRPPFLKQRRLGLAQGLRQRPMAPPDSYTRCTDRPGARSDAKMPERVCSRGSGVQPKGEDKNLGTAG